MKKMMKRMLVICALTSIVIFGGCKKQEPAAPVEPEVVETTAEKAKAEAEKGDVDAVLTKLKETMEADAGDASKKAEMEKLMAAVEAMAKSASEQTKCPVMGGDIDKNVFTTYKGKKVYFCCKACIAKFEAEPEKYISKLPQFQQ